MGPNLVCNRLVQVDPADTNCLVAAVKKVNIYFFVYHICLDPHSSIQAQMKTFYLPPRH